MRGSEGEYGDEGISLSVLSKHIRLCTLTSLTLPLFPLYCCVFCRGPLRRFLLQVLGLPADAVPSLHVPLRGSDCCCGHGTTEVRSSRCDRAGGVWGRGKPLRVRPLQRGFHERRLEQHNLWRHEPGRLPCLLPLRHRSRGHPVAERRHIWPQLQHQRPLWLEQRRGGASAGLPVLQATR